MALTPTSAMALTVRNCCALKVSRITPMFASVILVLASVVSKCTYNTYRCQMATICLKHSKNS